MLTPSTPPPEPPLEPPAYVQQVQDSPYERFNNAVIENPKPSLDTECREAGQNPDDDVNQRFKDSLYDSAETWADGKKNRDDRDRENDTAERSRNDEQSAAVGPPDPPDARGDRVSNSKLANSLADAEGISLAPEVVSDYRANTSPYAELAYDLSDKPDQSTQPVEDLHETFES